MMPSEVLGLWTILTKTKAFCCILPKSFPLSLTSLFLFSENYRKIASENHKAPILWPLAFHFCKKVLATGFTFLLDCCLFITIILSAKKHIYKTIKYYKFYTHCHLSAVRVRGTEPPADLHLMAQIVARLRLLLEAALIEGD